MDNSAEMNSPTLSYKNHGFPPPIIPRAIWFYFGFPLSLPLVEEMRTHPRRLAIPHRQLTPHPGPTGAARGHGPQQFTKSFH
ncbi:hypothetical protein GGE56_007633 [Rhizobium leguminosarum]|nr:hypothetical protein [Rhizobium leguminosarum]MBB6299274.1 hypothetical protein [Rhizobium leguminosarum]